MESITAWQDQLDEEQEDIFKLKFPLHNVCRDGDSDALSLLLVHKGQHSIYEEDCFYGWTPAHWAAYNGNVCVAYSDVDIYFLGRYPSRLYYFYGKMFSH